MQVIVQPDRKKATIFVFAYWHDRRWKRFVGATVKIWDLCHNLSKLGDKVVAFLPRYHFRKHGLPFQLVEVPFVDLPLLRFLTFSINLALVLLFRGMGRNKDIVYVRRGMSLVPLLFSKLKKAILVYEVNDDPYEHRDPIETSFANILRYEVSRKTDEVFLRTCHVATVITPALKVKICERNPHLSEEKLIVLPSGSNISLYTPLDKAKCRSAVNFPRADLCVGFVGSLLKHQGIDTLIQAMPYILRIHPSTKFVIIGEGPMKETWMKNVKRESLSDHVLFLGQIDYSELPTFIGAMDICVAPFLKSAGLRSPVKIFDYLACGKPVVSSDIPGTTDLFRHSRAVLLVPPEDPEQLAEALSALLRDGERVKQMGLNGRRFMEIHYDRLEIARRLSEELHRLRK